MNCLRRRAREPQARHTPDSSAGHGTAGHGKGDIDIVIDGGRDKNPIGRDTAGHERHSPRAIEISTSQGDVRSCDQLHEAGAASLFTMDMEGVEEELLKEELLNPTREQLEKSKQLARNIWSNKRMERYAIDKCPVKKETLEKMRKYQEDAEQGVQINFAKPGTENMQKKKSRANEKHL